VIRRLLRPRRGQALIEYAIALPVFLLLIVGVIDAGRAVWEYNTVAYLARDAARYGTIPTRSSADIKNYARNRCASMLGNTCATPAFDVSVTRGTCGSTTDPLIVTVSQQFHPVTPMITKLWGSGPLTLQARMQMYVEPGPTGGCAT
jgi:Flp pilus assembly protein TadG